MLPSPRSAGGAEVLKSARRILIIFGLSCIVLLLFHFALCMVMISFHPRLISWINTIASLRSLASHPQGSPDKISSLMSVLLRVPYMQLIVCAMLLLWVSKRLNSKMLKMGFVRDDRQQTDLRVEFSVPPFITTYSMAGVLVGQVVFVFVTLEVRGGYVLGLLVVVFKTASSWLLRLVVGMLATSQYSKHCDKMLEHRLRTALVDGALSVVTPFLVFFFKDSFASTPTESWQLVIGVYFSMGFALLSYEVLWLLNYGYYEWKRRRSSSRRRSKVSFPYAFENDLRNLSFFTVFAMSQSLVSTALLLVGVVCVVLSLLTSLLRLQFSCASCGMHWSRPSGLSASSPSQRHGSLPDGEGVATRPDLRSAPSQSAPYVRIVDDESVGLAEADVAVAQDETLAHGAAAAHVSAEEEERVYGAPHSDVTVLQASQLLLGQYVPTSPITSVSDNALAEAYPGNYPVLALTGCVQHLLWASVCLAIFPLFFLLSSALSKTLSPLQGDGTGTGEGEGGLVPAMSAQVALFTMSTPWQIVTILTGLAFIIPSVIGSITLERQADAALRRANANTDGVALSRCGTLPSAVQRVLAGGALFFEIGDLTLAFVTHSVLGGWIGAQAAWRRWWFTQMVVVLLSYVSYVVLTQGITFIGLSGSIVYVLMTVRMHEQPALWAMFVVGGLWYFGVGVTLVQGLYATSEMAESRHAARQSARSVRT